MIVVRIDSGTGNQLFQFAAAYALAERTQQAIVCDPLAFAEFRHKHQAGFDPRRYVLPLLDLPMQSRRIPQGPQIQLRGYARIRHWLLDSRRARYHCPGHWTPEFAALPSDRSILLTGYFQDVRYWTPSQNQIVQLLHRAIGHAVETHTPDVQQLPENTAAMHIRGGDYVRTGATQSAAFQTYYRQAAVMLLSKPGIQRVAVFTDDPSYALDVLRGLESDRVILQDTDTRLGGLPDLWRMARAPALAIANSTFSWWAARLAAASCTVLAPARWTDWCRSPGEQLLAPEWEIIK